MRKRRIGGIPSELFVFVFASISAFLIALFLNIVYFSTNGIARCVRCETLSNSARGWYANDDTDNKGYNKGGLSRTTLS